MLEFKHAEEFCIKTAINKKIKNFEFDKSHTIRSVLECPFCKVVLDYLIVNNELVLKPNLVKSKIDMIMKGWTRKYGVVSDFSDDWSCQYQLLESTLIQSPIFAIGSVIEDALEKNQEQWLVLQNRYKAYNSVGWKYLRRN
ncbi:hypothetical protein G9A89_009984 [Geosiphon pyriformis]|nr:hypothetical protein G9A89_009984 [Geosiphon pyriformis]